MLKKIYLELTDDCNLECEICYRHQWVQKPTEMEKDTWKKTVNQILDIGSVETVLLGGMGEPMVSPFFKNTLKAFRDKEIAITTNATYITSRGEVVPCYRLSHEGTEVVFGREKTLKQYSFGNIHDRSLREIWDSPPYQKFRNRIFNNHYPSCPDCDLVDGCSLIHDVDFDCHGEEPNCADCLWSRKFVFCN